MDLWAKARDRAKELAQFDLDAMAEEDDYIHTESLNVSKTSTTQPPPPLTTGDQQQQPQSSSSNFFIRQDSVASQQSTGYPVTPAASSSWAPVLPDAGALQHMASSSSWSLLDRKPASRTASGNNINADSSTSSSIRVEEATARLNALVFDTSAATTTTTATAAGEASTHSSAQRARIMSSASEASKTLSMSDDNDDDDASQDSYDEDDPILSLLQQQQKPAAKTKNRFMNDLDQRLAQPAVPETVNPLEMEPSNNAAATSKSMPPPRRLWPWQKPRQTATNSNANNNNDDDDEEEETGMMGRPLWARPKKKKPKPTQEEESFVLVSSGNLGFSEEEKQALASLRQSANKDSAGSGNILSDHPRESFVALTLVLGGAVYWFARTTAAADDFAN